MTTSTPKTLTTASGSPSSAGTAVPGAAAPVTLPGPAATPRSPSSQAPATGTLTPTAAPRGEGKAPRARTPASRARPRGPHKQPVGGASSRGTPPTGLQAAAEAMSEDDVERALRSQVKSLRSKGIPFLAWHPWKQHAKKAPKGLPDWILLSRCGLMFRELKRQGEKPTPEQQEWLDMLNAVGVDAAVWEPIDVLSGRMARELAALAGIGGSHD